MRFRTAMRAVAAVGIHALSLGGAFAQQPSFTAHVASATTLEDALAAYAHLKTLLPSIKDPFVHQVDLGAQGVSFRVRVGGLMTKPQAEALCATILAVGHPSCSAEDAHALARTQPGYYGDLLLKFLSDGRNMEVAQPFGFVDSQARKWEVPTGTVTDGASIPQAFWSIIGSPFVGKFRLAAVIHDHYCKTKLRSWADTHAAFYESMIASGEDKKKALLMWAAVYRFGPRWAQNQSVCWGTCAGDPAYRGAEWFPAGQWRERCNDAQMDGDMLKANCLRSDGAYRYTEYNARECQGRPIIYSIRDGQFSCAGYSQATGSGHFPSGAWGESCNNASMRNSVLRAQCQTNSGQMMSTQVDTNKCPRGVWNNNGQLTCQ